MPEVKFVSTFRKDNLEYNGLIDIANDLIKKPAGRWLVAGYVEVRKIETNVEESGQQVVHMRLVSIEPLSGKDAEAVEEIVHRLSRERTGTGVAPTLLDHK